MKRENFILILIAFLFISKSQAYTVLLNGNDWPGYVSVCNGASFHAIVTVNGAASSFSYLWVNADNSDTLGTSLSYVMPSGPGYYTFKILINGILDSEYDLLVFEDEELGTTLTKSVHGTTNITAWNGYDGWINSQVQGGTTPYNYLWSNGSTTANIDSLNAGIYTLTVQDDHGCTTTSSVTMTAPAGPLRIVSMTSPAINNFNITEKGKADGKINLVVAGGGGQYKYKWYPYGNPTANPDTLTARKYTVVVSDTNDAEVTQSITLNEPNKLEVTLTTQDANCNGCSNGSITANVTGGVPNYSYFWSTGDTTPSISNLPAGDYKVRITDANGAKAREAAFIKQPDQNGWLRTGNSGTDPSSDFMGTIDNKDLVFRTNNTEKLRIKSNGQYYMPAGSEFEVLRTGRIQSSDSLIHFGDSSMVISTTSNQIFADGHGMLGIGIGGNNHPNPTTRVSGTAFGLGDGSVAIGNYVKALNQNSIVIGSGFGTSNLSNSTDNSLYVGFNSTVPTFVVTPATLSNNTIGDVFGKVGIGTSDPLQRFHLNGSALLDGNHSALLFGNETTGNKRNGEWGVEYMETTPSGNLTYDQQGLNFSKPSNQAGIADKNCLLYVNNLGNVGIGVDITQSGKENLLDLYKLSVNGDIRAKRVKVEVNWPDYVFEEKYKLKSIEEVAEFIRVNKHLPGIPSALEINSTAVDLGNSTSLLLEKVEELTLYIIELKKSNDKLTSKVSELENIKK